MKIEIFNSCGCGSSDFYETVKQVAAEFQPGAEVIMVSAVKDIAGRGIMRTPALAVDGKVVCAGRVPKREEIAGWLG
jgi:hypothetical protein